VLGLDPLRFPKPCRRAKEAKRIVRKVRPRKQRKSTRGKMGRLADKLFSLIVRYQRVCKYHAPINALCSGSLQCAHIVSRYYRSVRWDEANAMALCAGAHRYFTSRPLEWEAFVLLRFGAANYEALKRRALQRWDGDLEGVLVRLAARAVALGIKA